MLDMMDIKVEGTGGSGIQYRSKTNIPWLANIGAGVANNNGPVNLDWMTTGPQADFWPTAVHTGQAYSDNWSGQVGVELEAIGKISFRNVWLKKIN